MVFYFRFVAAAGYAEAATIYGLSQPQFIFEGWAVAPFSIPTQIGNGTAVVNTTGILSTAHCLSADNVQVSPNTTAGGFNLVATYTVNGTGYVCAYGIDSY